MICAQVDTFKRSKTIKSGFTLIELLVTIGVFSILASFISLNLINPHKKASVDTQVQTLVSDIKSQQLVSVEGEAGGSPTSQKHGIFVSAGKYTLFTGNAYTPLDPNNFDVVLEGDLQLSTTFASSILLFEKISGEVTNFTSGQNTLTLTSPSGGLNKTITVNPYGSISVN